MNRIDIPFTNEHFAAWCMKMIGQPYWYGTTVNKCDKSLLERKTNQYPEHYKSDRTQRYLRDISGKKVCSDCVGAVKGYMWTSGGQGVVEAIGNDRTFRSSYGDNGCPDKSANNMFEYAKTRGMDWGVIGTMPEIVGIALRFDGHMGFYVGGGYAVEWRGFNFGCVKTKVAGRGWTHWCKLPFINYDGSAASIPAQAEVALGSRLLKKGTNGDDVKALQELLLKLGYDLGSYGVDGEFGAATEKAVIAFQRRYNLTADGKYGDKTHTTLMSVTADDVHGREEEKEDIPEPKTGKTVIITAENNGSVNVRVGNGTNYALITTVHNGAKLPYIATAENGWYAVIVGSQVGWVSGKYAKAE